MKENKNYVRKRKKVDFSMSELESLAEDEMDDDFKTCARPNQERSPSKRLRN